MTPAPSPQTPGRSSSGAAAPGIGGRVGTRTGLLLLLAWAGGACAGGGSSAAVAAPLPDPSSSVAAVARATTLDGPTRIFFDWSLTEEGIRVRGRGVARVQPPDRARLDLFLSNGEAMAGAILVGDDVVLPVSLPDDILPPPELLWGTVGTLRLGSEARVVGGDELEGGGMRLVARLPDDQGVRFEVIGGRVRRIEQTTEGGTVVKTLVTRHDDGGGVPLEATYRDLTAFRELILQRDRMESVDGFPDDIWSY